MQPPTTFKAPWAMSLKVITGLSLIILIGIAAWGIGTGPQDWGLGMNILPLLIPFVAVFFVIRGYTIKKNRLLVKRLGWSYTLDLTTLISAEADTNAMARSIRTFGNGGLFCFAGAFRNKKLGSYRAFATDPKRAVVLRFIDRVVVITPENPEEFVNRIEKLKNS